MQRGWDHPSLATWKVTTMRSRRHQRPIVCIITKRCNIGISVLLCLIIKRSENDNNKKRTRGKSYKNFVQEKKNLPFYPITLHIIISSRGICVEGWLLLWPRLEEQCCTLLLPTVPPAPILLKQKLWRPEYLMTYRSRESFIFMYWFMRDIYTACMCSSGTFSSGPENDLKTTIESHFTHP